MKKFENIILNKLIKKYEKSKLSNGYLSKRNIFIKFDSKNMPEYVNEESYKYEKEIVATVKKLEEYKFITVVVFKDRIEKVILNLEKIEEIYKYLNIKSRNDINKDYFNMLDKYKNKSNLTHKFNDLIVPILENNKSYKKYFSNINELEDILKVLEALDMQKNEISRRSFSVRVFQDSKKLEKIQNKIEHIVRELNVDNIEEGLEKYNVFKNPGVIYIRGSILVKINNQIIDTSKINYELVITSNQLNLLEILEVRSNKVITIENLTTFYDFPLEDNLIIYLGGFHNSVRRELLIKIKNYNSNINFYHFGDIDAGGFYILKHLREKTNIDFKPIYMDINTLIKFKSQGKNLTDNDKVKLKLLKSEMPEYEKIFQYMLDKNIKIEQESIVFNNKK